MGAAGRGASDGDLGKVAAGSVKSSPPRPAAAMALSGFLWQHRGRGLSGRGLRGGGASARAPWASRVLQFGVLLFRVGGRASLASLRSRFRELKPWAELSISVLIGLKNNRFRALP